MRCPPSAVSAARRPHRTRWRAGLLLLAGTLLPAAQAASPLATDQALPTASANAGKVGTYRVASATPDIAYHVCVGRLDANRPIGVHVFHHGLGGKSMAGNFMLWMPLLQAGNLIGINMEYGDNNPHEEMAAKAAAARAAVAQVVADYPAVVPGLGAMTAFSAGGSPAGAWFGARGKTATAYGLDWPFCQMNVFGSSLNAGPEITLLPCSWYRAMGSGEEQMAPGLSAYFLRSTQTNLKDPSPMACPDAYVAITQGRGHTILPTEVAQAGEIFARSSLMIGPFLRADAYHASLRPAIAHANTCRMGEALRVLTTPPAGAPADQVAALRTRIQDRLNARVAACIALATNDPAMAEAYSRLILAQCQGLATLKAIETALAPVQKTAAQMQPLRSAWAESLPGFFAKGAITDTARPLLYQFIARSGTHSAIGTQAARFLK